MQVCFQAALSSRLLQPPQPVGRLLHAAAGEIALIFRTAELDLRKCQQPKRLSLAAT